MRGASSNATVSIALLLLVDGMSNGACWAMDEEEEEEEEEGPMTSELMNSAPEPSE